MQQFGLPELEIKDIPLFLSHLAMHTLNQLADYMINYDVVVKPGERIGGFGPVPFKVVNAHVIPGDEEHYAYPVLQLIDMEEIPCACCNVEKKLDEIVQKVNEEVRTEAEESWVIRQIGCACSACGEEVTDQGECWVECPHNGEKPD